MTCNSEVITLEPWEQSLAHLIGTMRQGLSSANGAQDPLSHVNSYAAHAMGVAGELAFAKWRNIYPLLNYLPTKGGADCLGHKGQSIDVKTTSDENGHLIVGRGKKHHPCDNYVLMIGNGKDFRCGGYATSEEVFDDNNLGDGGHGLQHCIDQGNLRRAWK